MVIEHAISPADTPMWADQVGFFPRGCPQHVRYGFETSLYEFELHVFVPHLGELGSCLRCCNLQYLPLHDGEGTIVESDSVPRAPEEPVQQVVGEVLEPNAMTQFCAGLWTTSKE